MSTPNPQPNPLDIQDFLEATGDSSKRTRTVAILLIVASVMILAGLLNSLDHSWMHARVMEFGVLDSEYVAKKIGEMPDAKLTADSLATVWGVSTYESAVEVYANRHLAFYRALCAAYVDSGFLLRVPFFGFVLDVNDLGLVGGIALLILLGVYQLAVSREIDNLAISFREAKGRERQLYLLLAMRQVFTIPQSAFIKKGFFLRHAPKAILLLPVLAQGSVVGHDWWTSVVGRQLGQTHTAIVLCVEAIALAGVIVLTRSANQRLHTLDRFWDDKWKALNGNNATK